MVYRLYMTTTIQINETTLNLLKQLKDRAKADSYNTIIERLIQESLHPKKSMFGFLNKNNKVITRKRMLHDLRDKSDR